jgi:hypothetical protein
VRQRKLLPTLPRSLPLSAVPAEPTSRHQQRLWHILLSLGDYLHSAYSHISWYYEILASVFNRFVHKRLSAAVPPLREQVSLRTFIGRILTEQCRILRPCMCCIISSWSLIILMKRLTLFMVISQRFFLCKIISLESLYSANHSIQHVPNAL